MESKKVPKKRKCVIGKQCGNTCIHKEYKCKKKGDEQCNHLQVEGMLKEILSQLNLLTETVNDLVLKQSYNSDQPHYFDKILPLLMKKEKQDIPEIKKEIVEPEDSMPIPNPPEVKMEEVEDEDYSSLLQKIDFFNNVQLDSIVIEPPEWKEFNQKSFYGMKQMMIKNLL
jgi:hypothetical protein